MLTANRQLMALSITTVVLVSCNSYVEKTPVQPSGGSANIVRKQPVAYAEVAQSLLGPYCIKCHNSTGGAGGIKLDTYANVMAANSSGRALVVAENAAASRLVSVIADGAMPPRSAKAPDTASIDLLRSWIDSGAQEFLAGTLPPPTTGPKVPEPPVAPPPPPPPPVTPPGLTFAAIDAQILEPHCVACHSGANAAADIDLSSYAALVASNRDGSLLKAGDPQQSQLYLAIADDFMPPEPPPLEATLKQLMAQWITEGAQP